MHESRRKRTTSKSMSIEAQLFELREFAQRENIEILEEFTESKSAKKPGREMFGKI